MKITKTMRILLVLLASVMVFSLFACTDEPIDGGTTEPQGNETTEAAGDETTAPKGEDTTAPKGEDTTAPKGEETTAPKGDETTDPKEDDTTDPKEDDTTDPKEDDTTAPKEDDTTAPKEDDTTDPKEDDTTDPKEDDTTAPKEDDTTAPKEDDTVEPECKHENAALDKDCNLVCSDCKVILDTDQHKAGDPDAEDACNVKCENCGKVLEENKHTAGDPDPEDHCNVKCTVCKTVLEEKKHTKKGATADPEDHCNIKCTVCSDVLSQKHGESFIDTTDNCQEKCSNCKDVVGDKTHHNVEGVNWTPVLIPEGGAHELYEEKKCTACQGQGEIRPVAFVMATDNIYLNGKFVKRADFTTEHAKSVTTRFGLGGWLAINGGVEKYVYRVNDGEWQDAAWSGDLWDISTSEPHVKSVTDSKLGLTNYGHKGGHNSGIYTQNLQEYATQDITIQFGVIPKNNAGTPENPNIIIVYTRDDITVQCDHSLNTGDWTFDTTDPQTLKCDACSKCGQPCEKEATATDKGLLMFGPEYMISQTGTSFKPTLKNEGGMSFIRVTAGKESGELTDVIFSNTTEPADATKFKYIAVLYRSSSLQQLQVVYDGKSAGVKYGVKDFPYAYGSDQWTFGIATVTTFDHAETGGYYDGTELTAFRVDYFNTARPLDATVDVAFIAYFETEEDAWNYYKLYCDAYSVECGHYRVDTKDGYPEWKLSETKPGYFAQYCQDCKAEVRFSACQHHDLSQLTDVTPKENADGIFGYTANCGICGLEGVDVMTNTVSGNKIFSAGELFYIGRYQTCFSGANRGESLVAADKDANDMPYLNVITDHIYRYHAISETYIVLNDGTTDLMINKYFAVLYRTTKNGHIELFISEKGQTGAETGKFTNKSLNNLINDGEWHLGIMDISTMSKYSTEGVGWTRLDFFNPGSNGTVAAGSNIDVAYVGFFATEEEAENYYLAYLNKYMGVENCDHRFSDWVQVEGTKELSRTCSVCDFVETKVCDDHVFDDTKWEKTDTNGIITNTCTFCNETVEVTCEHRLGLVCEKTAGEMKFKFVCALCGNDTGRNSDNTVILTPEQLLGIAGSEGAATETDADLKSKPVADISKLSDPNYNNVPYLHVELVKNTTQESYLNLVFPESIKGVGKYVTFLYRANQADASEMFISATGGIAGGQNVSVADKGYKKNTVFWTMQIIDFSGKTHFDAETGIKKIRWDFNTKNNKGHFLDVAYLGFFNSQAEAEAFYAAYSAEYELDYSFNAHKDGCTVNGSNYTGPASSGIGSTLEFDFSGYTFESTPTIKATLWFLSSLGTESYQYRYIVEGEDPVLGETFTGMDRGDVGTSDYAKALGFGADSGNGSGIGSKTIPLTGYENKTVTVEIIAKCKDGKEVVAFRFKNITIPAATQPQA